MTAPDRPRPQFPAALARRYQPRKLLGLGGMGAVFEVQDLELGRRAAAKVLLGVPEGKLVERFLREARAMAAIRHPNVVEIYDFGQVREGPFIVMELLEGHSLDAGRDPTRALEWLLPVADALEVCHRAGVVHRDVKPANIFRTVDGRSVLTDFGVVKDPDQTALTRTGAIAGTMYYLSPEVLSGDPPSPAMDWWALGVTLYELAEGRRPFDQAQVSQMAVGRELAPPRLERLAEDSATARALRACLARDPRRRPTSRAQLEAAADAEASIHPTPGPGLEAAPLPTRSTTGRGAVALRAGLAALAMGGLALAIWPGALAPQGTRAEAPPETPAPAPRGSRPDHPFGPDLVQEVRRELREAGELAVDAEGHLRPLPQGPLPAGWRELVDPDPVRWPALRQNLGVLLEVDAWRAQGGQVERLPRATDARLAAADRLFAQALLPEPFAGLRGLAPTRTPESFDQLLDPGFLAPARVPEDLTGWMGAALRARRQIADARQQLKDEVAAYARTGVASPYLPTDLMPAVPLLLTHPKTLIREGFFRPQSRVHIRRWMAPGVAALRRLMLATARALAPGQPERARRAAALRGLLSGGTLFLFSELSFVDLPTVTGLDPQDDLHAHVLVGLERDAAKVRREVQDEREPAWLVPALERLSRRPIREIEDAFFVAHAGREQVERWRAAGQPEAALRAYRQALATLGEHDAGPPLGQLHTQAILTWLDAAPALAATPAERAVVTTFLRGHPQLRPSAGEPRQRAAEIDAWLAAEG